MATTLRISHRTEYLYDRPVRFGPHRLMVRPRDGHDLWVENASLLITPKATLRWHFDPFGNSIADAMFAEPSDRLVIQSDLEITRYPSSHRLSAQHRSGTPYPFTYSAEDRIDLAPLMELQYPLERPALQSWLDRAFVDRPDEVLGFLCALSEAINRSFDYQSRDELGTQTAGETISSGRGTCRDFAFLFMEAARSCGFAARFVTGYLHDSGVGTGLQGTSADIGIVGGGATHAWADIYIPGEGWVEFDPTNRIVGSSALIRVAATRTPEQASPISGSYLGAEAVFLGMTVNVDVSENTSDDVRRS